MNLALGSVFPGNAERCNAADEAPSAAHTGLPYREYSAWSSGDKQWRVTDVRAVEKFAAAKLHLPNAIWSITVEDLRGAVAAEVTLDRWGGHRGTINKRIRFNQNDWITVPEIQAVPPGIRAEQLMFQDHPTVTVPIDHLREGINQLEANCDEAGGFGWGQWGMYAIKLRVYFDSESKSKHRIEGRIVSPVAGSTFADHPVIEVDANASMGVARIDVFASYEGLDEDGDGRFDGFHYSQFQLADGQPPPLRNHVGTMWESPYRLRWNTDWMPDQKPGTIELVARIQDSRGYWRITPIVKRLSLKRPKHSIRCVHARNVPEDFSVRVGETKSCDLNVPVPPPGMSFTDARLHLRTWHGWDDHHEPLRLNEFEFPIRGKNHFYDEDWHPIPPTKIVVGNNAFTMHSRTEHHMLEVLWPGPSLLLRYEREGDASAKSPDLNESSLNELPPDESLQSISVRDARYEGRPHHVIGTAYGEFWLDLNAGGFSRLIDAEGKDWISFRKSPWGEYPAAAASSFRGLPNLVHGGRQSGFGHPGWDRAETRRTSPAHWQSRSVTTDGEAEWVIDYEFGNECLNIHVTPPSPQARYWFLYEGPIAGRWKPDSQSIVTNVSPVGARSDAISSSNTLSSSNKLVPADYQSGKPDAGLFRWAHFRDDESPHKLAITHENADAWMDQGSFLGNTTDGLAAPDGMVVFGFGRGIGGIQPLLRGSNTFTVALLPRSKYGTHSHSATGDSR
ncbi:MAG: hypothetical protein AAF958_13480 [Planctomycetota bacterium]